LECWKFCILPEEIFIIETGISGTCPERLLRASVHQLLVSPATLSPTPSTSSSVKTLEETEEDPNNPKPAGEGGVKMDAFPISCTDQVYEQ